MKRLIIGISGASGVPITIALLKALKNLDDWTSCLVISKGGEKTIEMETDYTVQDVIDLADEVHDIKNIGASIASGTYKTEGMVIVPCSMKTVAGIANGYSDNLLLRAADVVLKERRKLVLVARETPFNTIHLKNMLSLSQMGAIIMPPVQTYYNMPETVQDMIDHITGKILDVFDIDYQNFRRWNPESE
ncbi:Probable aromatic acid decarboxylase [uncultured Roseburia sp.]|uniref:Flavin prenyltransferase UbiX n=1 Tax=Brotonthovivens ammoniilytica TaxID=2981725 RepID=A0ABT2TEX6_9FIRM|nr:UbiX family flavin prenyltransferase [Brotonthovivens ammoniilytica]MCU6760735.1 UbiX family flavin prenyltransferase [Brotonthovivens ammoniilytica]SCI07556.1 Probable aromatic acid decarboxylase [uncultured Roseburia sp.]